MDLSIIIVNWNTRQLLEGCLDSIYKNTHNINFDIFVVDNASHDNSAEMVEEKFSQVHLIKNNKNVGFATANNQAIRQATGKYILILNPDTLILSNTIEHALEIIKNYPEIGILGPKTLDKNKNIQKTVRRDPNILSQLFFPSQMKKLFPNWGPIKKYYFNDFDYDKESLVPQLQGSCLLINRELFQKIGFFDEKFFIWFEEVDLCLRTRKAEYKILYSPDIEIIHYGGESFMQINTIKKQALYSRSMLYYFYKNKPKWQWFILLLFKLPIIIIDKIIK
ncbi:MAG: glycosyltransferase family 2 protein [Parcubacteria group bacterium CG10_big_fil_rev_8_21_14_0_10_36_14]|nr:MAG: glycosyltransferase family 2 protein [Parcubacteria group bacterium CG10_big_fil_rev_8_21_14_0_10_36_14]